MVIIMIQLNPSHIGVLVEDIDRAMEFYTQKFGVDSWQYFGELREEAEYYGKPHKLCYKAAMASFDTMQLELIQPTAEGSVFADDLKAHGPGIHHICVKVDDIEKAIAECKEMGFTIIDKVPMYEMEPGFPLGFCFIDSDKVGGMKLEIVQEVVSEKA